MQAYFNGTAQVGRYDNYSYYTGENKTVIVPDEDKCSASITAHIDNNGTQTRLYCSSWDNDFDVYDYVDLGAPVNYFYNAGASEWQIAANTSAVGRYKTHPTITLKEGLDANYTLVYDDLEWKIYGNTFDLSAVTWDNNDTYLYAFGTPEVIGVPDGVLVS